MYCWCAIVVVVCLRTFTATGTCSTFPRAVLPDDFTGWYTGGPVHRLHILVGGERWILQLFTTLTLLTTAPCGATLVRFTGHWR